MELVIAAALSIRDQIETVGAYAGLASVLGLAVLALLYFAQAREVKRLREWAGRAPERAQELEERVVAQAEATRRVVAQPIARQPVATGGLAPATAPPQAGTTPAPAAATPAGTAPKPAVPGAAPATAGAAAAATGAPVAPPAPPKAPATPAPASSDGTPPAATPAAPAGVNGAPSDERTVVTPAPEIPPVPAATPAASRPPAPAPAAPLRVAAPSATVPARPPAPRSRRDAQPPRSAPRSRAALPVVGALIGLLALGGGAFALLSGGGEPAPSNRIGPVTEPAGEPPGAPPPAGRPLVRGDVTVAVLNGTTVPGLAAQVADTLERSGFRKGAVTNAADQQRSATVVSYVEGRRREANEVARILRIGSDAIQPIDASTQAVAGPQAIVVVTVGADRTQ